MARERKILRWKMATPFAALPVIIFSYVGGPDPRKTGAPGDNTCAQARCHDGTAVKAAGAEWRLFFRVIWFIGPALSSAWRRGLRTQRVCLWIPAARQSGVAQDAGRFRRGQTTVHQVGFVSRRSRAAGGCSRQHSGAAEWFGVETAAAVRQLLAGERTVASIGADRVLA